MIFFLISMCGFLIIASWAHSMLKMMMNLQQYTNMRLLKWYSNLYDASMALAICSAVFALSVK